MTKEELIQKLSEIEWDDFECKRAQDKLPEDVWSTVSAFSNTSGGWIIFGVKQQGKQFEINGVNNGEKTESDFLNTLRNGQKFNMRLTELRSQIHSIPRNPNIIKFFRYAKLGENAGYGIDKMFAWERLTKGKVEFTSDLVCSTITYWFGGQAKEQVGEHVREQVREQAGEQVLRLVNVIREDAYSLSDLLKKLNLKGRRNFLVNYLTPAIEGGYVLRAYPDKPNHPNQRYYLSEKGLKLVK